MRGVHFTIPLFLILLQFLDLTLAHPLCTDSRAPFTPRSHLQFCNYNGASCCNYRDDLRIKKQFESMNISNSGCASLIKSILCSRCDPFSAELFRVESSIPGKVPVLCNSTVSANSTQSNQATTDFCSQVWSTCQNVSLTNSPFYDSSQGRGPTNSTRLNNHWQTQTSFCSAFGGASDEGLTCFSGAPVTLNHTTTSPTPPNGMCIEKIGNGSYINMVAHPDGSNRAFFANQKGQIWLATIPDHESGRTLVLDEADPFLDLTEEVHFEMEFGMLGLAFHPKFMDNGRFFVSFSCDKAKWPNCGGRCACNSDVDCDPSTLSPDNGAQPCQYQSVIGEYTVNDTSSNPSTATSANPSEVRRTFTMGLPFTAHHAGQILFGPEDGYLYFMMGDGGSTGDPYNFAQNEKSLLGKIMRFDIDNLPSEAEAVQLGLWGNYSIPNDNPFVKNNESQKEIWALGLRNPWRCSFDSARPSYFICADVGQDEFEEVNLITKQGNYGWRIYEGPDVYIPPQSPGGNTSLNSIKPIFPVMGYNHSEVNSIQGSVSASITGGYFYRSMTDPCMFGNYLYADLYGGGLWAGAENPINSGSFTSSRISLNCARDSPLACIFENSVPALGFIFSFGEDNEKDVYVLANSGVYRVVRPSRCNYACAKENTTRVASPSPSASPSSKAIALGSHHRMKVLILLMCMLFMRFV